MKGLASSTANGTGRGPAVAALTAALAISAGWVLFQQYPRSLWDDRPPKRINPGEKLPPIRGYAWKAHPQTLILALRLGCPYCEASMGFYESLHRDEHIRDAARMVAVYATPNVGPTALPQPLRDLQVFSGIDFTALGVAATPTLLLVDNTGVLKKVWRGQLSDGYEKEVFLVIEGRSPPLGR